MRPQISQLQPQQINGYTEARVIVWVKCVIQKSLEIPMHVKKYIF